MIGRRSNGRSPAPAAGDAELDAVEAEIRQVETMGAPLPDLLQQAETELEHCAEHYRMHGFVPMGVLPQEREHFRHLATVGALMVIGKDALLQAERERVTAAFQVAGGRGMALGEKAERLAALGRRKRQCLARREQALREREAGGEIIADDRRSGELFVMGDNDLQTVIDGKEAA